MTLGEFYKKVVDIGIKKDPRSSSDLKRFMKFRKEAYRKLKSKEEKELHKDKLWNPYDDTRIVFGNLDRKIHVAFVGIDISVSDLVLIHQLNIIRKEQRKPPIDLAVAHHPEGYALGGLTGVMDDIHVEVLRQAGVPVNVTEKVLANRIRDVAISIGASNLHRSMGAAQSLDIPLISCHTVADNNAYQVIKKVVDNAKPYYLKHIVDALMKIPAYKKAATLFDKPVDICIGTSQSRAGKIMIGGFTGGTEGSPDIFKYVVNVAGVGTTVDMHMSKEHRKLAEKYRLNTIVANHMASDSIGMRPIVELLRKDGIEIVAGSGYIDAPLP